MCFALPCRLYLLSSVDVVYISYSQDRPGKCICFAVPDANASVRVVILLAVCAFQLKKSDTCMLLVVARSVLAFESLCQADVTCVCCYKAILFSSCIFICAVSALMVLVGPCGIWSFFTKAFRGLGRFEKNLETFGVGDQLVRLDYTCTDTTATVLTVIIQVNLGSRIPRWLLP